MELPRISPLGLGSAAIGVVGLVTAAGGQCWRNGPMDCYSGGCSAGQVRYCETDATNNNPTGTMVAWSRPAVCVQLNEILPFEFKSAPCDSPPEGYSHKIQPPSACTGSSGNCCWYKPSSTTMTYPPGDFIVTPYGMEGDCPPIEIPE